MIISHSVGKYYCGSKKASQNNIEQQKEELEGEYGR
jgi:hypothetical protein